MEVSTYCYNNDLGEFVCCVIPATGFYVEKDSFYCRVWD